MLMNVINVVYARFLIKCFKKIIYTNFAYIKKGTDEDKYSRFWSTSG